MARNSVICASKKTLRPNPVLWRARIIISSVDLRIARANLLEGDFFVRRHVVPADSEAVSVFIVLLGGFKIQIPILIVPAKRVRMVSTKMKLARAAVRDVLAENGI